MKLAGIYMIGVIAGCISTCLLLAGIYTLVKKILLKIDLWLISKEMKNHVNQLHNNRPEKRKVFLERKNRRGK